MECYWENLDAAFLDHARRSDAEPADILNSTDLFVLHAPFRNMPEWAMKRLLKKHLGLVNGQTENFLESRDFYSAIEPIASIGNTYSASLYISLAFLLANQYRELGEGIIGKKLLLASYGSGNTMVVLAATVTEEAPDTIRRWNNEAHLAAGHPSSWETYEEWTKGRKAVEVEKVPDESFYLSRIREDGYREYAYTEKEVYQFSKGKASRDLHEPVPLLS
jgi:hydroxymethylglutaryl-CoA synthase